MTTIERLRIITEIATQLQASYSTSQINIFLGGFGIGNSGETIVPSKRVYVENKLSKVSEDIIIKIAKEMGIIADDAPNFSKIELLEVKEDILTALTLIDFPVIDLILDEYHVLSNTHYSNWENKKDYIKYRISKIQDSDLVELWTYLQKRKNRNIAPDFWGDNKIKAFISHLSKDKIKASLLSSELIKLNIAPFVAHEDIEPNSEWLEKIEQALMSMDILIVLVSDGFKESNWTCQEVGFALGRGIPVISIKIGMDPFGFFGKKQAIPGTGRIAKDICNDIIEILRKMPEFSEYFQ